MLHEGAEFVCLEEDFEIPPHCTLKLTDKYNVLGTYELKISETRNLKILFWFPFIFLKNFCFV
jgi:hypothetical protein